ncbi:3-oxoacyl-[acyl-carrier-protein] reductase FabG-like [Epargyreus clarus]|uniref:3-oxoacyl-[acyl-carrier-protein] reductase FabG-like n=1 Tax=Epargyreus clarus TaxID=520877 RepID=UPI003C2CEBAE
MSLKDKAVIVTGGGSGIGASIAMDFAKEGANVAIVGRNVDKLIAIAKKCTAIGNEVLVIRADVSKDEDAIRIVQKTVDKFGKLDVLVNNAGVSRPGCVLEGDILQAYDMVMNTNLRAVMHLTTLATPHLIKTKGNIINISSAFGLMPCAGSEVLNYSISKAALNQFTRCAANELASLGIRVNAVSPGPVETDILVNSDFPGDWNDFRARTALDRVAHPQEIADLVLFLASDKAKSITGSNFVSDNGMLLK